VASDGLPVSAVASLAEPCQLEATLIGPLPTWTEVDSDVPAPATPSNPPAMRLVDASQAGWHDAPGALLRQRLTAAAIMLVGCLALLFVRSWWLPEGVWSWLRGLILVHTLGCLVLLVGRRKLSLNELRGIELALFVPVGIQLYSLEWTEFTAAAAARDLLQVADVTQIATFGFSLLMMAYGMFMPNSWRRTAVMLIPPMIAPMAITLCGLWLHPWLHEFLTPRKLIEIALVPAMSAAVATYGTRTIAVLRQEAKQAQRLGQYRLLRELGHGGMGQVFLAEHQLLKRPCAVKVIHSEHVADPSALARFEREVRSTASLSHWHTVEVYDYGHTEDGTFYSVMEYLPVMNLAELVKRFGPLPIARALHFLRQTCSALKEAHRQGMIHRDLKPANIFAAERGGIFDVTKLLDFGLVADPRQAGWITTDMSSPFAGSPHYMSPEQAQGQLDIDPRSDIYSLGAVGYFLVTGRPPFEGRSPWQVMLAHARHAVQPPSQLRCEVTAELEAVLLKCLAKRPEHRYPDVTQLAEALDACATGRVWTFRDAEAWWCKHGE
jgi:serine/threonine-protein kinase